MTSRTTVDVWLVGATFFNREALSDLDSRFRNTEKYRERLRVLTRLCKSDIPLSKFVVAIGIAAEDEAAISFLSSVDIFKLHDGYLAIGSLDDFLKDVKRRPRNEVSIAIKTILGRFK